MKDVQADINRHTLRDVKVKGVFHDEVLVRVLEEPRHRGLILTSEEDRGYTSFGRVEKVGPDVRWVMEGDIIVMDPWKGRPFYTATGRKALIREQFIAGKVQA